MTTVEPCWFTGSIGNRLAADAGGQPGAQRELIAAGYRVVSLDSRGHGESDWIGTGDYGLGSQVADVAGVARAIDRRPALVGTSMGGVNAMIACGDDPGLARALALVDVTPRLEPEGIDRIERFMGANLDGFATIESAGDAVAAYYPARARPADTSGLRKNLRLRADGRWYWHWDPAMFSGKREPKIKAMRERMLGAAERIRIPTLLVRGAQSEIVSLAAVDELRPLAAAGIGRHRRCRPHDRRGPQRCIQRGRRRFPRPAHGAIRHWR